MKKLTIGLMIAAGLATAAGVVISEYIFLNNMIEVGDDPVEVIDEEINNNVQAQNGLAKFENSAFNVTNENNHYFVEIFGATSKTQKSKKDLTMLKYNVDKNFFELTNNNIDFKYLVGEEGRISGAESTFVHQPKAEQLGKIAKTLVEVTKEKAVSVEKVAPTLVAELI